MYTAQTLYPWTSAGEGTNNKNIQDTSAGANDSTTKCNFGTNTSTVFILAKPLTTNSTSGTPTAGQDFGWNILKANMNASEVTAVRRILAGSWTFNVALTGTADVTGGSVYGIQVFAHKRSATGTLTQIFNVTSATVALTTGSANVSVTKTGVSEVQFANNETLQIEYWVQGHGIAITGQTVTLNLGTTTLQQENTIVLPAPGIRTIYFRSISSSTTGLVSIIKQVGKMLTMSTTGIASVTRLLTIHRSISGAFTGVASVVRKLTLQRTFASSFIGTTSQIKQIGKTLDMTMVGTASMNRLLTLLRTFTSSTVGISSMTRLLSLHRTISGTLVSTTNFVRQVTIRRTISTTMVGQIRAWIQLPLNSLTSSPIIKTSYSRSRVVNK